MHNVTRPALCEEFEVTFALIFDFIMSKTEVDSSEERYLWFSIDNVVRV